MLPPELNAVTQSYHRCMHGGEFVDTFYKIFLAKSDEVQRKFVHTDFNRQKLMLRESLLLMLMYNQSPAVVRDELVQLGERHSRHEVDIPPHLYDLWLDSLVEAVEQHDPEFTSELADRWRHAMQPGIELLQSRY